MKTLSLAILLTMSILTKGQDIAEFDMYGHKVLNKLAPNFKAKCLDNSEINLEDLKGKVVLLDFWSLSCAACFKELPELNEVVSKYSHDEFVLISLMDNTKDELLNKFDITNTGYKIKKPIFGNDKIDFQIIPDAREIMMLYTDMLIFPRAFLIDQNGIVTYHCGGYAEKLGIPDEITTKDKLIQEIERLLSASR